MVLLPWSYTNRRTSDYNDQIAFARRAANALKAVHGHVYQVGTGSELLYVASGTSKDYTYGTLGVKYSMAVELRGTFSFFAPCWTIIKECQEMWAFHKQAGTDIIAEYVT